MQEERFDWIVEEQPREGGIPYSVVVSFVVHIFLIVYLVRNARITQPVSVPAPMIRYVELMRQNPQQFVEAPGPKLKTAPNAGAPLSDANRKASSPERTGENPTARPGDGSAVWTPPRQRPLEQAAAQQQPSSQASNRAQPAQQPPSPAPSAFRQPVQVASAATGVDWRNAIRDVAKVHAVGSGEGFELGQGGGEKGYTADAGPLSFETQWFDWGDYAQGMVSRIRINWYGLMPELIRSGLKGVVTIRFTIHRDGRISDITILKSSGIPPYDNAAQKALEASSPLKPLPRDFPLDHERVTAMFYYNMEIPQQ